MISKKAIPFAIVAFLCTAGWSLSGIRGVVEFLMYLFKDKEFTWTWLWVGVICFVVWVICYVILLQFNKR